MAKPRVVATVLVPGITGTTLRDTYGPGDETVWSALQAKWAAFEALHLAPEGEFDLAPERLLEPGPTEALAYGECVGRLRADLGHPVYFFRYDWRYSNAHTARRLDAFVELVLRKNGDPDRDQVNLVTHSMGGLVLLAWLRLPGGDRLARVRRACLAAPPLLGSPTAVSHLVLGEGGLFQDMKPRYRKMARTFPAAYQLVGFYPGAFRRKGKALTPDQIWDAKHWQRRVKKKAGKQVVNDPETLGLVQRHMDAARDFHCDARLSLRDLPKARRRDFLVLYGTGVPTPDAIEILPRNQAGDVKDYFDFGGFRRALDALLGREVEGPPPGDGDGVVPVQSVEFEPGIEGIQRMPVPASLHTAWGDPFTWDDWGKQKLGGYHAMFLSMDKNAAVVSKFFQGKRIRQRYLPGITR